jgi:hypothetical protein
MVLLIMFNLSWIFFDALFESQSVRDFVNWVSSDFYDFYTPINADFLKYDLIFICIYLLELIIRWVYSITQRQYSKWYIYPLVHWYDVLGCIPIGAFHFLRVLRIAVILRKLQSMGVIQWQNSFLIKTYRKYMDILTEEVSDRVVVQVLSGMSQELKQGTPVLHQVVTKALAPKSQALGAWLSSNTTQLIENSYDTRKVQLHAEIRKLVAEAALKNTDLKKLIQMPIFGGYAAELIERTITDMIFDITDQIVDYFRSDLSTTVMTEGLDALFNTLADPKSEGNHLVQSILLDTIEVVKQQVQVQQWKTTYDESH